MRLMRFGRTLNRAVRGQSGFTLIELVVSTALFAVVGVISVGAFVNVTHSAHKVNSQRRVQQDARSNLEEMVRTTRSASLDYDFYQRATTENQPACQVNSVTGLTAVLALITTQTDPQSNPNTSRVVYFYDTSNAANKRLMKYVSATTNTTPTCAEVLGNATQLTAPGLTISDMKFYVSPPLRPTDPNTKPDSYRWIHPRVTFTMTTDTVVNGSNSVAQSYRDRLVLETSASTRAYPLSSVYGQSASTADPAIANDSQRIANLTTIHNALQAYAAAHGGKLPMTSAYGESNFGGWDYSSQGGFLSFIPNMPRDPRNDGAGDVFYSGTGYSYAYYCYPNNTVQLGAKLERPQDYAGNPHLFGTVYWYYSSGGSASEPGLGTCSATLP